MGKHDVTAPTADDTSATTGTSSTPGNTVGRFVILGGLGAGGMGVVVSAWDPTLDRKVALKLLRSDTISDGSLEREAQAMARLSHPNVATVYEIGIVGTQRFVAMELVDGTTLKVWMRTRRSWREVVAMFTAAGRGLEAAHAAGLVHRDFKPDNVLVGSDGRPRVSDFGLARRSGSDVPSSSPAPRAAHAPQLTQSFGGTPAYMAPEQTRGEVPDARSDQFSFCVALWEALHGERPFDDEAPPEDRHAPERPPRGSNVPAWLTAVVARGLSSRPEQRWPSLAALLEALAHDPATARRRIFAGAGAVVLLLLAVVGIKQARNQEARACANGAARLAGVWDDARKQKLEQAFVAGGTPNAAALWQRARALVDDYARRWVDTQQESCRATRIEGRQSEMLLELRMSCLERRRATLSALGDVWLAAPTTKALSEATNSVASLPPLDECSDLRALTDPLPLPRDKNARDKIAAVRAQLDRATALEATSKWADAEKAALAAQKEADATGYAPVQAEARLLVGNAMLPDGNPAVVVTAGEAARLAALAHDDRKAASALILLVSALSANAAKFDEALATARVATVFVARAGDPADLRGELLYARGRALLDGGKPKEALADLSQALPLLRQSLGESAPSTLAATAIFAGATDELGDHAAAHAAFERLLAAGRARDGEEGPRESAWLNGLGMVEEHAGNFKEARAHYEKALAIHLRRLGPDNEMTADLYTNLGNAMLGLGQLDAAADLYVKARDLLVRLNGADHPYVAVLDSNLGAVRRTQGRLDEAAALGERALASAGKAYGKSHPQYANFEGEYARTLELRGDESGARAHYVHALEVLRASNGADAAVTLAAAGDVAELDARHGRCAAARPSLETIAAKQKATLGRGHDLAITERALARCDVSDGRSAEAVAHLEDAADMFGANGSPAEVGETRAALARARWAAGDHDRALALAKTAENDLIAGGAEGRTPLNELRAWLRTHTTGAR